MNNKAKVIVFSAVAIVILLAAFSLCSRTAARWQSFGKEPDRIIAQLDSAYRYGSLTIAHTDPVDKLDSIAKTEGDKRLEAVACYWRGLLLKSTASDKAINSLNRAKRLSASLNDPYFSSRIRLSELALIDTTLQYHYTTLRDLIDYYSTSRDTSLLIHTYNMLGSFYLDIQDMENFRKCVETVENLYVASNCKTLALKNRVNFALYHINRGDSAEAASIIRLLLNEPAIRSDSIFMGRLYVNISLLLHEPDSMRRAIEISPEFRNNSSMLYTLKFTIAKMYNERGDISHCDSILTPILPVIINEGDLEAKKQVYAIIADRRKASGDLAGALDALERSCSFADSLLRQEKSTKISSFLHRDEVRRIDMEHEREFYTSRMKWLALLIACIALAALVVFSLWNRHRKNILARIKVERDLANTSLSLEREKRNVIAMEFAMTERDNLASDINNALDEMRQNGRISAEDKRSVSQLIKVSHNMQQNWESIKISYEKVHPHFLKRLSTLYPDLSEGDIRLALYISAGLNTKQISQLMRIRPESVKKNRQRLRKHMGIDAAESLEGRLREVVNTDPE